MKFDFFDGLVIFGGVEYDVGCFECFGVGIGDCKVYVDFGKDDGVIGVIVDKGDFVGVDLVFVVDFLDGGDLVADVELMGIEVEVVYVFGGGVGFVV